MTRFSQPPDSEHRDIFEALIPLPGLAIVLSLSPNWQDDNNKTQKEHPNLTYIVKLRNRSSQVLKSRVNE